MGKGLRERLNETIRRDKLEINQYNNDNKKDNSLDDKSDEAKKDDVIQENNDISKLLDDNEILRGLVEDDTGYNDDLYEEDYDKEKFSSKKLIVILVVLIISLSTVLVLWSNGYEIVNFAFNKVSKINEDKNIDSENEAVENQDNQVASIDIREYYEKVHHMANTIIIANDGQVWGKAEITKEAVNKIINDLKGNDDYLSNELEKWANKDFSNGVEVHNYVWDKLDGSIGKAKALNEEKIKEVIKGIEE